MDEKKTEGNEGKKPSEETTATKADKSKEGNSGENKSIEASKTNVNGTRQPGAGRHEASQGKNLTQVEKESESNPTAGEQKQQVQNGKSLFTALTPEMNLWPRSQSIV